MLHNRSNNRINNKEKLHQAEFQRVADLHDLEQNQLLENFEKAVKGLAIAEYTHDHVGMIDFRARQKAAHLDIIIYDQAVREWYMQSGRRNWEQLFADVKDDMQSQAMDITDDFAKGDSENISEGANEND